jgi:kelch-like protein 1/4/5
MMQSAIKREPSQSTSESTTLNEKPNEKLDAAISLHNWNAMKRIGDMYLNRNLCDIILICKNRQISAHRVVLSAVSDYFYAMFNSSLSESKKSAVTINDVDDDALQSLVDFIYTGNQKL